MLEVGRFLVFKVVFLSKARVLTVVVEGSQAVLICNHLIVSGQQLWDGARTHIVQVRGSVSGGLELDTTDHGIRGRPLVPHTISGHDDLQDACCVVNNRILLDVTASNLLYETREIVHVEVGVSNECDVDFCRERRGSSTCGHQGDDSYSSKSGSSEQGHLCNLGETEPNAEECGP